jgi:hypothetical protein
MTRTVWLAVALVGCRGPEGESGTTPPDDGTAGPGDLTVAPTNDSPADATIGKISAYQGVESVLFPAKVDNDWRPPMLAGRDAAVRLFVAPDDQYDGRELTGVLTVSNPGSDDLVLLDTRTLRGRSTDADLDSTLNFRVPAAQIGDETEMRVELQEADADGPGGGDAALTTWDSADEGLPHGTTGDVTIVILPVVYQADGSGRTPDVSQARLDEFRDEMFKVYPATHVTVRVGDPLEWDERISAFNGLQWENLLDAVTDLRDAADEPDPSTYYYGLFEPEETFDQFCSFGCILGLSQLAYNPSVPSMRASIGIGYPEYAASTLVHEVGHAHGREHSPCGGAAGSDRDYPYPGASIGYWGYDLLTDKLYDPAVATDVMGYCTPTWISDYTFYALWQRISVLDDGATARAATRRVTRLRTDGAGHTRLAGSVAVGDPSQGGVPVSVDRFDAAGARQGEVRGWQYANDHLPGGVVLLDEVLPDGWTARVADPR